MNQHTPNRREFLAGAAITAATGAVPRVIAQAGAQVFDRDDLSYVVQVASDHVVRGRVVHNQILAELLDVTLKRITGKDSSVAAWKSLLKDDDVIGLKFNQSAAQSLGVSDKFATAVVDSLLAAGFSERQIVPIEVPSDMTKSHGLQKPALGWHDQPTNFASGQDQLSTLLDQVTAIINIPFLKTHNIAGITCSLKNLSHALIRHPAMFHRSHCTPFIGDIVALPQIRKKLRLHLVNGLRVVFDKGPEAQDPYTWDAGMILAGVDPVATDSIGLNIINSQRTILGLPEIGRKAESVSHLRAAGKRGLGEFERRKIELIRMRL